MPEPTTDKPPTKEELEAEDKRLQAELFKPEVPEEEEEETPPPAPKPEENQENETPAEEEEEETPPPASEEGEEEGETPPPATPPVPPAKPVEQTDAEKFAASSREAQVLAQSKKNLEDQIDEAYQMPAPSDDEMTAEYGDLSVLTDFEKKLAKDNLHNKLINAKIKQIRDDQKASQAKKEARDKEVEEFALHPDTLKSFPKLEGKQEDFKKFASKPTRLNVDLEDLTVIFLATLPPPVKHKGQMFENGNGGPKDKIKPRSDKISVDESRTLRETNYPKYMELLKAGKISEEVV